MFDLIAAYILSVIGLTAGQLNFGISPTTSLPQWPTTSSPQCQNDAACTPPSVCIDNICAQGVSCKSNADCNDPRFECNRQFCIPKRKWRPDKLMTCKTDASCISPAKCVDNFCVVNLKCRNHEDCGSPHLKCIQSVCILLSEPKPPVSLGQMSLQQSQITTQNGQGASGPNPSYPGQIPDIIPPPPPQPITDCVNGGCPEGYTCIAGSCVYAKNCRVDSDCGGYGFKCIKNACMRVSLQILPKQYIIQARS